MNALRAGRKAATRRPSVLAALAALLLAVPAALEAAPVVFSASGSGAAAIQGSVDAFRAALGPLNPPGPPANVPGRREINWDGVPDARATPNDLPPNFFNANSPRGVVFSTPGTAVQVSANAGVQPVNFANIDPSYATTFSPFSAQRLFTSIGSNIVDVSFFVPGSNTAALTNAFGAVFSDVDLANTTGIEYFDSQGASLLKRVAPVTAGVPNALSFLGVVFDTPTVARVRITNGNAALGAGVLDTNGNPIDLVVMDDFIYGEPLAAPASVPEPATLGLLGAGLAGLLARRQRRR